MSVHIRRASRDDLPRIWEMLLGLARYEKLENEVRGSVVKLREHLFGPHPRVECLVAEDEGALIGYALFYPTYSSFSTEPTMWLEDLFVEPAARGKGAGKRLLAELSELSLGRGCARLGWIVLDWNAPSIEFYERTGARRSPDHWHQYGLDAAAMRKLADEG
jgi:GNAT superfamily N-acetyltransferase